MGAGMDKILPGLYVGSIRDSRDKEQLKKNNITHILSIYEDPKESGVENITYKLFKASDHASQDIKQFFEESIDFIHNARINNGGVLVHCLAGVSRSTTICISYLMTIVDMPWYDALNSVRAARKGANPNFGFQRQLQNFEYTTLKTIRENLYKKYGVYDNTSDLIHCKALLEKYHQDQKAQMVTDENVNQMVTSNPVKTYPFAFNQYNLDEEKPMDLSKKNLPTNHDTEQIEENKIEKDKVIDSIFK